MTGAAAAMPSLPSDVPAERVLDGLGTAVLVTDRSARVLYMNGAAEDLLGQSAARCRGQRLERLFERDQGLADLVRRAGATGRSYSRGELMVATTHDELFVDCQITPSADAARPDQLLVEIHDVSRRVRAHRDAALRGQRDTTRRMIRQLAHEIKNPLGGLRGAAQLLDRELADRSLHEYTSIIIAEADRLKALVDQLLGPGGAPKRSPVNVHELLQHVARLVAAEAEGGVDIRRDYDPSLPPLMLDRGQMIQAFLNLAKNALEAVGARGVITLRTRARANTTLGGVRHRLVVSVEIEDDGPGIPPELQDTVFFPLVTSRGDGTGLGLPLAQEIVNRHGGLVEFDSRPGRTVFKIGLPAEPGDG